MIKSAVVIAKLLGTEGFTDHLGNQIEKYWKNQAGLTDRQKRQLVQLDKAISEISHKLDVKERLAFGRFIGLHKKMSFDAGLRIGLTTHAVKNDKETEGVTGTQFLTAKK